MAALVLAGCLATAWPALRPGDPALALQTWTMLRADKGEDFTDPLYVDVALYQQQVAPWQEGHAAARERLRAIQRGRLRALEGRTPPR